MESFKAVFIIGIYSLPCISYSQADTTRRPIVHEMRDAIHQVGYNYPSWPSPESSYEHKAPASSLQTTPSSNTTTLDQFYRVEPDGTVEFKVALSDGHINYQKIYNKIVDGRTIQVYDGYYSVRLADGRYRNTYYTADEMGYRLLGLNVGAMPPYDSREQKREKCIECTLVNSTESYS